MFAFGRHGLRQRQALCFDAPTHAATMFAPLMRALRAIFVDELQLQRGPRGLSLGLQRKAKAPSAKRAPAPDKTKAQLAASTELAPIQRDLATLFDSMPGSRRALCHLAYVEQELTEQGLARLQTMALNPLRQALGELENAVVNWSPTGLASLRSKMAVALREREAASDGEEVDVPASRANLPAPEVFESRSETTDADLDQAALLAAYGQSAGGAAERV